MPTEHIDVIVVGAGISGIGAGYHLQTRCPDRSYAILEARETMGGTWDLFRYPGIRSDSDMHTLGFSFKPWSGAKAIADGPSILAYVKETAAEFGIDRRIRYATRVVAARWSTADAMWTVDAEQGAERTPVQFTCDFLVMCSGYYNYARGYSPEFAGSADFDGQIVHPQLWPEDLDYAGKRVVVIGSGATAVTLVPEMAKRAAQVTMLQRSPTYIVSRPSRDGVADWLRDHLPARWAYGITRWKNVLLGMVFYRLAKRRPDRVKSRLLDMVRAELGPDYDVATHLTPSYNPWDQRICLVPDSDLFSAIRSGKAEIVTGRIQRFYRDGIRLEDGRAVPADIIVTATGLDMQLLSNMPLTVDGEQIAIGATMSYKGMMFSGVPNLAASFGYVNASWTLKVDLTARYVCRLLNAMRRRGMRQVTPRIAPDKPIGEAPMLDFSSGYVQRAADRLPRQGSRKPWRTNQNYALDVMALRFGSIDREMEFSNPEKAKPRRAA